MAVDLKLLRQVVALAEHGSFVRAASMLHVSQPALSRSIQLAEHRFGRPLFERTRAGVVPTDIGRVYLERARDLLRMADAFDSEIGGTDAARRSRAAMGAGPFPAESFLGPAAARLIESQPHASIQIVAGAWDELQQHLRNRRLDFFVAETSTLVHETDLEVEQLGSRHALHFFARADHPLAGRHDVTAVETAEWPFVTPARMPPRVLEPMLRAHHTALQAGRSPRPLPTLECSGIATVKRVVRSSNAISGSILSCIAAELEAGDFVLLGTEQWLHLEYGIVSLRGRPWTQTARRLHDYVIEAEADAAALEAALTRRFAGPTAGSISVA